MTNHDPSAWEAASGYRSFRDWLCFSGKAIENDCSSRFLRCVWEVFWTVSCTVSCTGFWNQFVTGSSNCWSCYNWTRSHYGSGCWAWG